MQNYIKQIVMILMIGICSMFLCGCEKEAKALLGQNAEIEKSAAVEATQQNSLPVSEEQEMADENNAAKESGKEQVLYVYICGEVVAPGVYEMSSQERICTLIQRAGGLTEHADPKAVNQAQLLEDGQMVYIPSVEEGQERSSDSMVTQSGSVYGQTDGRININSASQEQLMSLPGIGEGKAGSIISYREEHGKFTSIEELMNVDGIKEGTYEKLKDRITV